MGAGATAAALLLVAAALFGATSMAVQFSSRFSVDVNLARFALSTGYIAAFASVLVNCLVVIATSIVALRTPVLPSWFAWAGFAVVPLAIVESMLLFPIFLIPLWVLLTSIILTTQPEQAEESPPPTSNVASRSFSAA